jgi:hypothetical protein
MTWPDIPPANADPAMQSSAIAVVFPAVMTSSVNRRTKALSSSYIRPEGMTFGANKPDGLAQATSKQLFESLALEYITSGGP